jgi:hypothetical protein
MIKVNKFYTYKNNNKMVMQCLARYEAGGVAVHHTVDSMDNPMIIAQYLGDTDLERGTVKEIDKPIRGYVNLIYNGDTDTKYLGKLVYNTELEARLAFREFVESNPYIRLVDVIEIKANV